MSLARLLEEKGGRMPPSETERALSHLLIGVQGAHGVGLVHGPLRADEVLVDRRGSASIELYGLARRLHPDHTQGDIDARRAEEVASLVRLGYRLLTGLEPADRAIPASRLVKRLDRRWDAFFVRGLGDGFAGAADALAHLPGAASVRPIEVRVAPARSTKAAGPWASGVTSPRG